MLRMYWCAMQPLPWTQVCLHTHKRFATAYPLLSTHTMHAGGWCSEEGDGDAERWQVEEKAKRKKRKKTIDIELTEIEPLVTEAIKGCWEH